MLRNIRRALVIAGLAAFASAAAQEPPPAFLNINPSWSPDGRQLVFQSERTGTSQLYVIGADGTGERRLTWSGADDTHPAWSPDGRADRVRLQSGRRTGTSTSSVPTAPTSAA